MARFDSGAPAGLAETLAGWLLALLSVPLLTVLERLSELWFPGWFPGLLGYIPFAVNATLWGIAAMVARRCWRNQPSRRG
jgi:hypothetical protein